ncbi:MAG: hypothetical protein V7707_08090 [Motiliproteus sp.]
MPDLSVLPTLANIATVFIALCALVLTYAQVRSIHKHNRISVRPYLTTWEHIGGEDDSYVVDLINGGTGPAIIKSCTLFLDDKPMEGTELEPMLNLYDELFSGYEFAPYSTYWNSGFVLSANQTRIFGKIQFNGNKKPTANEVTEAFKRANVLIKYESAYAESFTYSSKEQRNI